MEKARTNTAGHPAMLTVLQPQGSCAQIRDTVRALLYLLLQLREDELVQDIVQNPHRNDVCPAVQKVHHWLTVPRLPLGNDIPNERHPDLPHEPVRGTAACGQPHCWLHASRCSKCASPQTLTGNLRPMPTGAPVMSWLSALGSSVEPALARLLQAHVADSDSTGLAAAFPSGASVHNLSHWGSQLECPLHAWLILGSH